MKPRLIVARRRHTGTGMGEAYLAPLAKRSRFDFEVIGGREEWIDFITDNPIYWTVFGFAITPTTLSTLLAGAVTSLGAAAISFFLKNPPVFK